MALEATTGWRFVVEELERVGAEVHLAEPAEAAALKGKKKRAKTDWADARHLRELLLIGRLPESGSRRAHPRPARPGPDAASALPPADRVAAADALGALSPRVPQQRNLLTAQKREWLAGLSLPAAAREQLTIALSVIDAIELKLVPFDRTSERSRKQPAAARWSIRSTGSAG